MICSRLLQIKPVEELFHTDSEIDLVFNMYCDEDKIHVFGVKCAFLNLYGEEFSTVSL